MKSITALTLLAAAALDAAGQTATIGGIVSDQNGNPLSGVTVVYERIPDFRINANGQRVAIPPIVGSNVASNAQGAFVTPALPGGAYHVCTVSPTSGQLSSCLYEPKPLVVSVGKTAPVAGVQLVVASGAVVTVQVNDAAGHIRAGAPFAIGATAIGSPWAFFAKLVSQSGSLITYQMTLPRDYNFQLVVDTSLPVTGPSGAPVEAKQPGATLTTISSSSLSAAFVVN
jgi:hypothetical protein